MAETKVKTPIGEITVRHPDGASEEKILRFAQMRYQERMLERGRLEDQYLQENAGGALSDSALQNALAGAGKFFVDATRGVKQLLGADNQDEIDESRRLDRDLMSSKAGIAGNILGGVATTLPLAFVPGANTALGATALGAGLGALSPVATGESRAVNTAIGGAGGYIGSRIGRALGGQGRLGLDDIDEAVPSSLNKSEAAALREGRRLGMQATPGTASGSRQLQRIEAKLESQPITSGPFDALKANNQRTANRIVAESIGEIDDVVDSNTLGRAFDRMSEGFESFASKITSRPIETRSAFTFLRGLQDEFSGLTKSPVLNHQQVEVLTKLASNGQASGRQLRQLTSKLGRIANNEMTTASGDREMGIALFKVKEFVDDIIEEGLSATDKVAYQQLRQQYRNYALITSRANIINPSSGNVSLRNLAAALASKDKPGFVRGGNTSDLYGAARFGQAFPPIVGDSGTATRTPQGIFELMASIPAGLGSKLFLSQPSVAIAAGGNAALKGAGGLLGPVADPRITALIGANVASNR